MCYTVRTVTIDEELLATMGSEECWMQSGETRLKEEQKDFIGRYSSHAHSSHPAGTAR